MNIFGIIALAALLADYLLTLVADILNVKTLSPTIPKEFDGVYDIEAYKKSQKYLKARTIFGLAVRTFNLAFLLMFWFTGTFADLDNIVRGWGLATIWTGLGYIGILVFIKSVLAIPFSIYSTFVIEEDFGFNRTTIAVFVSDLLKSLALGVILGGSVLVGILAFFEYAGEIAWLYSWIAATVFILILQFVAPTWIMPLFNKFTPLENAELKNAILSYAKRVDFSLKDVYVMDGSKRSSKSNAFFTGFGKNKRIALFDTLIGKHSVHELVAILAHEIGHYKKKHVIKNFIVSVVHMGMMFFVLSIVLNQRGMFDAFYMKEMSIYAGLIFFGLFYTPVEFILSLGMHAFSRKNEYEADRYSVQTTGRADLLVDALKKMSVDNLSNLTPHRFYVFLNYSHPPMLNRIRAIRNVVAASSKL